MGKQSKKAKSRIQLGKLKLDTLLRVTKGINESLSIAELVAIYKHVLIEELNIGKVILFTNSGHKWNQELCIGAISGLIEVEVDLLGINQIYVIGNEDSATLRHFDVVVPVFHKAEPLAYLLLGDFDGEKIEVSPIIKHLTFIQALTNIIIVAIENKRLVKENINQIGIRKEMELASEMQNMLFPKSLPNNERIEVAAKYKPHQLVGGDYYDFIELNSDEIAFCIADVSGKGVPAALLMANFQASLRVLIKRTSSLSELVIELNANILKNANREKFITTFIGKYNMKTRNLQYINAGHNPPMLLVGHQFTPLNDGATILGMFDNLPSITEKNISIAHDSILTCFTDGVIEQTNKEDEAFDLANLQKVILTEKEEPMEDLATTVITELEKFKGEVEYKDDIAILALRMN